VLHTPFYALRQFLFPPVAQLGKGASVYMAMAVLFCCCLVVANLIGAVLIPLQIPGLGDRLVSAGIFIFPITFVLTDVLNDFYGEAGAKRITMLGFFMALFFFGVFQGIGQLPILATSPISTESFHQVSRQFTGMIVASLTAYLVGQFLDIYLFSLFKRFTGGRYIWFRATGSTLISQGFDSFIVTFIAFWGTLPPEQLLLIGRSNYEVKLLVAVAITPVLYGVHHLVQRLLAR
jgi:queuosine precursor transporter